MGDLRFTAVPSRFRFVSLEFGEPLPVLKTTQRKMKVAASFFTVAAAGSVSGECGILFSIPSAMLHTARGPKDTCTTLRRAGEKKAHK
jgi:hypothetical protein